MFKGMITREQKENLSENLKESALIQTKKLKD